MTCSNDDSCYSNLCNRNKNNGGAFYGGGTITVSDEEQIIYAVGLEESKDKTLTLTADPQLIGRFTSEFKSIQEGVPITEHHYWQVVDQENILGYFTFTDESQGMRCDV